MQFEIKALKSGAVSLLSMEASSEVDAAMIAKNQGYIVLSIKAGSAPLERLMKPKTKFPLVLFSQELLALLDAGLSLVEALEALTEKERHLEVKKVLDALVSRLYEGQPLSTAMLEFPAIFPPLFIATLRASEKTGGLGEALARYVAYQTQLDFVRKKIVSAMIYPVILLGVGGLVVMFLMGYVVPKFAVVYEGSKTTLPWMSQMLLKWGVLLQDHGETVLISAVVLIISGLYGLSRPALREWLLLSLWRIPALGERMRIYQLARFYKTLAMLLKGGIPVVQSIDMVTGLLQPVLRTRLKEAVTSIREGKPISQAMEAHGLTTPVALRMLRVGERTGDMGGMMERIATFYDEEMARWVEWFTKMFEPILMAFIGVVIGGIVILMYMPVFDLAGSIQ